MLPKTFITGINTENIKSDSEENVEIQLEKVDINKENNSTKDEPIKSNKKGKNSKNDKSKDNDTKNKDSKLTVNGDKSTSAVEDGNSLPNGTAGSSNGVSNGNDAGNEVKETERVDWQCDKCKETVNEAHVYKLMDHIGNDLEAMEKGSVDSCLRYE